MNIYSTTVTNLGPGAGDFLEEKMIILFKGDAPAELAEFCILHEENDLAGTVQSGDTLHLGEHSFTITAVGSAVDKNLEALGHITIKADGSAESDLPGTLNIEEAELPAIHAGDKIQITR